MRRREFISLALIAAGLADRSAFGQAWPSRTIRLIAPFPAGGGTDSSARIVAARLSDLLGQQVIVDNRPGAGSNIGAEAAARSAPDGYTMLLGAPGLAINRFLYSSLGYDFLTDLAPVSLMCRFPNILAVSMSSPITSVRGFIDHAKANPGKVTFSSPGIGTTPHLSGELFAHMAGIKLTHVPYRGAGAGAVTDAIAGRVDAIFNTTGSLLQTVRTGQLRGLAVTTARRFPTRRSCRPLQNPACRDLMCRRGMRCSCLPGRRPTSLPRSTARLSRRCPNPRSGPSSICSVLSSKARRRRLLAHC